MANDNGSVKEVEESAWMEASEIMQSFCVPMVVRTALDLNVFEILAAEEGSLLSASEIVSRMQAVHKTAISNPTAHISLDRILRALGSYGFLSCSLRPDGQQLPVRTYGINAVGRYHASGPEGKPSLRPLILLGQDKTYLDSWRFLEQAILEGADPFTLAHGANAFVYGNLTNREFGDLFNSAMTNQTKLFGPFFLQAYDGLKGVNTLVDVAGGTGIFLSSIVSKYTHIKGINFDQPHVIASAPSHRGVKHVGGDIFKSIPQADAIIMKSVIHDWPDEACVKILENCYKALPEQGKVIVVDVIVSSNVDMTPRTRISANFDIIMYAFCPGGKERTEKELRNIANAAGFPKVQFVCQANEFVVTELYKR